MLRRFGACAAIWIASVSVAQAAQVSPTSYDMLNGNSGQFNYWDDAYNGIGNNQADGTPLTGGIGDLTDGVVAALNWIDVEGPGGPNGPYVGWLVNPVITFKFANVLDFEKVIFHFDDSDGFGGVSAPTNVNLDGNNFAVAEPPGSQPFALEIPYAVSADEIVATITRRTGWVFLSEVEFFVEMDNPKPVPVPGGILLLGSALIGFGCLRKRQS